MMSHPILHSFLLQNFRFVWYCKNHSRSSVDPSIHGAGVQAQAPDDLSVRRGDWVYADLNNQTVDGWLWAYAPKTRKYGFIPKAYARPPAMTSL